MHRRVGAASRLLQLRVAASVLLASDEKKVTRPKNNEKLISLEPELPKLAAFLNSLQQAGKAEGKYARVNFPRVSG